MLRVRSVRWTLLAAVLAAGLIAAACGDGDDADEGRVAGDFTGDTLTVLTHDSFDISQETITAFEDEFGVTVEIVPIGDAVEALNRVILTKNNPEGDLLFGVDNIAYVRAWTEGVFEVYRSPALAEVDQRWIFDDTGHLTPVDYGYVLFNYQREGLDDAGLAPPAALEDLTTPPWKGRVAVEDPNTSSPGQQFMLATIAYFGEEGAYTWLDFWRDLRANDVIVSADWSDAYYAQFSQYGGEALLVMSYATSPAAEVIFAETELVQSPTGNVLIPNASYLQIEGVGILKNASNVALAQRFIDFMLSERFQEDIPLHMFVYPVRRGADLPQEFIDFADVPAQPAVIDAARVLTRLEEWLDQWTATVLR